MRPPSPPLRRSRRGSPPPPPCSPPPRTRRSHPRSGTVRALAARPRRCSAPDSAARARSSSSREGEGNIINPRRLEPGGQTMGENLIDYRQVARTAVRKSLAVKKGENVIVETWNHGLPIAKEVIYELRDVGATSLLLFEDEETYWRSLKELPKQKLGQVGSHEWAAMKEADAYVFVPGPADVARIREIGWEKYDAATAYNLKWYKNAERWGLRGVRISLGYATQQRANSYGFDWAAWQQMLVAACGADPKAIGTRGRRLEKALGTAGRVHVTAPNGTDYTFDLPGRSCEVIDGATDN